MSKYEWERGTITIPSAQWAKFRTGLIKAWNDKQMTILALAKKAVVEARKNAKGKRGQNRDKAILEAVARVCGGRIDEHSYFDASRSAYWGGRIVNKAAEDNWDAVTSLIGINRYDRSVNLHAPKKQDLKVYPTSKSCTISLPYAYVTFDNTDKTITWDVPENNHACESAREHWFAGKVFEALGKVEWKRGSGGMIVGNDEYNRDSDYDDGGGNYVTARYEPKRKSKSGRGATMRQMRDWERGASGRYW